MNRFLKPPDRILHSFSAGDETVYKYLMDNMEQIDTLNITAISNETYCSPSTVFNLLKKLGYSGFKEYKYACKTYQENISKVNQSDQSDQLLIDITGVQDIYQTIQSQKYEAIFKVCQQINNANRILVISNEITRYVAKEFVYRLRLCNVDIIESFDFKQYETLLTKETYDYIIVFSKYGNTEKLIHAFEKSNRKVDALITTNDHCYLSKFAKIKLIGTYQATSKHCEYIGDLSSRIALHIIGDMIVNTYVYSYLNEDNDEKI